MKFTSEKNIGHCTFLIYKQCKNSFLIIIKMIESNPIFNVLLSGRTGDGKSSLARVIT